MKSEIRNNINSYVLLGKVQTRKNVTTCEI